eukprot:TRINITY_DN2681_c0_g1_i1.p1 TRINITY_DN2681_c0_g1~~TRINITY_DN2681_c0_g1_i1.p1  ORF type:complete len:524 (+),score=103.72 TRINITY_DN2681_c0_g1_i1:99-1670(+)
MFYKGVLGAFSASVLFALVTTIASQDSMEEQRETFDSYLQRFGKSYADEKEYEMRFALFQERSQQWDAHNRRPDRLWTAGMNHYSDFTEDELKRLRGWSGVASSTKGHGSPILSLAESMATVEKEMEEERDWTFLRTLQEVRNQKACGSCWAVTSVTVLDSHAEIYNQSQRNFAAQELVNCMPNPRSCGGTGGCHGATVELAMNYAVHFGLESEAEAPYTAKDGECHRPEVLAALSARIKGQKARQEDDENVLQLMQKDRSSGCCFKIGFGSRMVPCCLTTTTGKSRDECLEEARGIVGGSVGWRETCPSTAQEAFDVISGGEEKKLEKEPLLKKEALIQRGEHDDNDSDEDHLEVPGVHVANLESAGRVVMGLAGWERLPENRYMPLMRAVYEHGPVGVSVAAHEWHSYNMGIFDGCKKDAVIDHAVTLVGFGVDRNSGMDDHGTKYWLIQNSWGDHWGEDGRIRLLRSESEETEHCGVDSQPEKGTACKGGPAQVKVCGMCGILYDTVVPHFKNGAAGQEL